MLKIDIELNAADKATQVFENFQNTIYSTVDGFERFNNVVDNANNKIEDNTDKIKDNTDNVEEAKKGFDKFQTAISGTIDRFVSLGNLLVAGAVYQGIRSLYKQAEEAADSLSGLQIALNNVGESYDTVKDKVDGVIDSLDKQTRYTDNQLQNALKRLLVTTGDYQQSLDGLTLATNIAAGLQMDLETASRLTGMAMQGNYMMLARYVPELRKLRGESKDAAEGMRILEAKFKGVAAAMGDNEIGQIKKYEKAIADIKQEFGLGLLPYLSSIASILKDLPKGVQKLGVAITILTPIVIGLTMAFKALKISTPEGAVLTALAVSVIGVANAYKKWKDAVNELNEVNKKTYLMPEAEKIKIKIEGISSALRVMSKDGKITKEELTAAFQVLEKAYDIKIDWKKVYNVDGALGVVDLLIKMSKDKKDELNKLIDEEKEKRENANNDEKIKRENANAERIEATDKLFSELRGREKSATQVKLDEIDERVGIDRKAALDAMGEGEKFNEYMIELDRQRLNARKAIHDEDDQDRKGREEELLSDLMSKQQEFDDRSYKNSKKKILDEYTFKSNAANKDIKDETIRKKYLVDLEDWKTKSLIKLNETELKHRYDNAAKVGDIALTLTQAIVLMGGEEFRKKREWAIALIALEQSVGIMRIWAAAAGKGPWAIAQAIASTALLIAKAKAQIEAVNKAANEADKIIAPDIGLPEIKPIEFGEDTSGNITQKATSGRSRSTGGTTVSSGGTGAINNYITLRLDLLDISGVTHQRLQEIARMLLPYISNEQNR